MPELKCNCGRLVIIDIIQKQKSDPPNKKYFYNLELLTKQTCSCSEIERTTIKREVKSSDFENEVVIKCETCEKGFTLKEIWDYIKN